MGRLPVLGPSRLSAAPYPSGGVAADTRLWPGWMLVMEKWLAEASFLLRLLMAPSSHPKGSGKHLPRVQNRPCSGRLSSPETVTSWGLPQPWMPSCLPHPLAWLQNHSGRVHPQSAGFRHHGSGKLFAELAGGGSLGRGPRKPASGAEPTAPGAQAVGSTSTLCTRKLGVGQRAEWELPVRTRRTPGLSGTNSMTGSRNF